MDDIKANLDDIQEFIAQDNDWVHVTVGGEGSGKSTLNAAMSFYVDSTFSAERMHFNGKQFRHHAMELDEGQAISHDEAIEDLYKREGMATNVRKMIKFLRKCRYLNLFITLSLPSLSELDRSLWDPRVTDEPRVRSIIRTVKSGGAPGWCWFYSQSRFSEIDLDTDSGIEWPEPDFKDDFPDVSQTRPTFWENYMAKKDRDISDDEQLEEEQLSVDDIAAEVKDDRNRYVFQDKRYDGREYVKQQLIEADFDVGKRVSEKVKAKVEADLGIGG